MRHTRQFLWENLHGCSRWGRLIVPDRIHKIVTRFQNQSMRGQFRVQIFNLFDGVQPRIEADFCTFGQGLDQPVRHRVHRNLQDIKYRRVALRTGLQGVAPIDEQNRLGRRHDTGSRRAGKAADPGKAFVSGRDIFALMHIRTRHHEGVNAMTCQPGPQGSDSGCPGFGAGGCGKVLKHARPRLKNCYPYAIPVTDGAGNHQARYLQARCGAIEKPSLFSRIAL